MTKSCPKCGNSISDDAQFCSNCGYDFNVKKMKNDSIFSNGKIFLVLIAAIVIIGGIFIVMSSFGGGNSGNTVVDDVDHVDLTITETLGWNTDSSYTLYTNALFNSVPDDLKGYNLRVTYYDDNNTKIGQEMDSLENVYYDSDYALTLDYYQTYKKPNPDYVTVEVIKDGKVIDMFNETVDKSKIEFLN